MEADLPIVELLVLLIRKVTKTVPLRTTLGVEGDLANTSSAAMTVNEGCVDHPQHRRLLQVGLCRSSSAQTLLAQAEAG